MYVFYAVRIGYAFGCHYYPMNLNSLGHCMCAPKKDIGRSGTRARYPQSPSQPRYQKKWNESGIRPPLCTYRLNWARRTSWGWWDDWDDTVLQTHDSKFEPWRSEAEHATSRSRRLPTILTFTRGWGRNIFISFKPPRPGTEPRTLAWKAAVLTTTLGPPPSTLPMSYPGVLLYLDYRFIIYKPMSGLGLHSM